MHSASPVWVQKVLDETDLLICDAEGINLTVWTVTMWGQPVHEEWDSRANQEAERCNGR